MNASKYKDALAEVTGLCETGDFKAALARLDVLRQQWPGSASLCVRRAELIQLQDDEHAPSLKEAKKSLNDAVALDERSVDALLELGFFELNVEDKPKRAVKTLDKALALLSDYFLRTLLAKAQALKEANEEVEADFALSCATGLMLWAQTKERTTKDERDPQLLLETFRDVLETFQQTTP